MTPGKMFGSFAFHIVTLQSFMGSGGTLSTAVTSHSVLLIKKKIRQNWAIQS
jgi:hypothetical protein